MRNRPLSPSRFGPTRAITSVIALVLAGCASTASSGADDKAGGSADPVVLRLANTSYGGLARHPALQYFVDRVEELSHGALRIDVAQPWGENAPDAEQQVVRDVTAGKIELGSVGTHVFDTVGINEFRALTAPMLIDNYPLQQAVLDSDIPAAMLAGLDRIGLDGIAVLGDGLRKPIAVAHPLLGPADYRGITFEAFRSRDHADAIAALGATPTDGFGPTLDAGLRSGDIDGFEKGLLIYAINETAYLAPYVTANVNLWPHTLALFANPQTMAGLTQNQRNWLTQAGIDAASRSTQLSDDDADLVDDLCQAGARFANASDSDLAAMREAFDPVYATLNRDPITETFIEQIEALKETTGRGPELDIPSGCTGVAAATPTPTNAVVATGPSSDALDGTYRWTITREDALAHGTPGDKEPESLALFPTTFTMTMNGGTWDIRDRDGGGDHDEGGGTYTVEDDRIVFDWHGTVLTFSFAVDDDGTLHLEPQPPMNAGDQFIWATNPWTKIANGDGSDGIAAATSLDGTAAATSLDGTYRWTITADDAMANGLPGDKKPEYLATFPWVFTITMTAGTWELRHRDGEGDWDDGGGSFTIDGDQVAFAWQTQGYTQTYTYSVDDDRTLHLEPQPPINPGDQFVWATNPWEKID